MLNIYYGRESVDKEKFIYENIRERGFDASSPVIVLVPDQYTLEAERQAFRIIGKTAFIGLDVYSISRLGHNVLAKAGQGSIRFIDKYGRQMLLTKILAELKDELKVYSGNVKKPTFIEMVNDYISSLKQYGVTPEMLAEVSEGIQPGTALAMKMDDLVAIYRAYDESIRGKYTDSEDYVDLFVSRADSSELLKKAIVWVYGFDSFAPKSLKVLAKLMSVCPEVNAVLTYDRGCPDEDLFGLTGKVIENLKACAMENGAGVGVVQDIRAAYPDDRYLIKDKSPEIMHLEHELFAPLPEVMHTGEQDGAVTITEAANYYNEAESAASFILHLVRDKGYRYRDIAVICNDREGLGSSLERAFDEYGIPCFLDNKRNISGSGIAAYITALIQAGVRGMKSKDVFRALKTGLGVLSQDETEKLEDYAICFRIDRYRWKVPFTFGADRYGEEGLAEIEGYRKTVCSLHEKLNNILSGKQTYSEFLKRFYTFLTDDAELTEKLELLMRAQEDAGLMDLADETRQIWQMILSILDQINNILGEEEFDADEFLQIFSVGLRQAEIGIMPPSPDDLMIGTMQRTRAGRLKALVVVGANDGVIPQGRSSGGLFAEQEEELLLDRGFEFSKSEQVRREEERLAISRNFSKPENELWISYTTSDSEGGKLRRSELIDDILRIFPDIKVKRDILNTGNASDLISGRTSTLRHLTEALVNKKNGVVPDPVWGSVLKWYEKNEPEVYRSISDGLGFVNRADDIGEDLSDIMFSGRDRDSLSVSRLESYALCPFSYFVNFGLKPEERRIFEAGLREIGDVYHDSLMQITSKLSEQGLWGTITEDEVAELVHKTVASEREQYGAGLFGYSKSDSYRADRAEQTIRDAVNVLISHARYGSISESRYEEAFGKYGRIKPVEVDCGGKKVYIEGKIDRMDILDNGRVKIMDYKSGSREISSETVRAGYTLQLMVYMKAAQEKTREPAGVFYFHLGTKGIDVSGQPGFTIGGEEDLSKIEDMRDASMHGILVDDPETIRDVLGDDENGKIASIRKKKSGEYSGFNGSAVMSEEEFSDLQDAVDDKVKELAEGITNGKIEIHPMANKNERLACRYCEFKGICRFDTGFNGCSYNRVD